MLSAGAVLVVCVDLNVVAAFDQDLDRIGVIPGASVYPFVWNILLAARNEGYGGVLTTHGGGRGTPGQRTARHPRGLRDRRRAAARQAGPKQVTKLTRKPVAEIATRERFDGEPFSA